MTFVIPVVLALLGGCAQLDKMQSLVRPHLDRLHGMSKKLHGDERPEKFFHRTWAKNLDPSSQRTGNLPLSILSPVIHQGMLFQGSLSGRFLAYSLDNGRLLWQAQAKESINSPASIWRKLIIYGDLSGRIYAHDFMTGRSAYSFDVGRPIEGKVIFFKGRGFVHTRNHFLISFDASTGKILWSFKRSVPYSTTVQGVSDPLVYRPKGNAATARLIVGFGDGYLAALSLEDGLLIWEKKLSSTTKFADVDMTPKLHRGRLYVGSYGGKFTVLNPSSGEVIRHFDFMAITAPVFYQGKMFVGTLAGDLRVLSKRGRLLKRISLGQRVRGPVTGLLLWKGQLVLSNTDGELVQIDPIKLAIRSRLQLGHPSSALYGRPLAHKGYLAVMGSRNRLYLFQ